jgi:hypothetical protein
MKTRLLRVAGLFAILTLLATYPVWLRANMAVLGDIGDPVLNSWILAWDAHTLLRGPTHIFDANVFFPLPNTLAYSEHLFSTAILLLPLQALLRQPVLIYNLNLLLSFWLSGIGMYLLLLRWTRQRPAAMVAGAAFAFAPYRLAAVAHLQLLTLQWLPFALLALDGLLYSDNTHRQRRWGILLGLFLALQALASWYLAVFSALVMGIYLLVWMLASVSARGRKPTRRAAPLVHMGAALTLAALLCLPLAIPYLRTMPDLLAARPPDLVASLAAHPGDYLAAADTNRILGPLTAPLRQRPQFTQEHALYPGLAMFLLALIGLASVFTTASHVPGFRWRVGALGLAAALSVALTFEAPYSALIRLLPYAQVVRVPARWMIPAAFALAALSGFGMAAVTRWLRSHMAPSEGLSAWSFSGAVVIIMMVETFSAPLPLAQTRQTEDQQGAYTYLEEQAVSDPSMTWGIVELPLYAAPLPEYPETKRMLASTAGWWGLVNGYSGFTPSRQTALAADLSGFPDPTSIRALQHLGAQGVRYLVVHTDEAPFDAAVWNDHTRWLAAATSTLAPIGQWGAVYVYVINPYGDQLVTAPEAVTDPWWHDRTPQRANVTFSSPEGEQIALTAYRLQDSAGQTQLILYWQAQTPLAEDYTVFVHSLGQDGAIIAQADGPPLPGCCPTSTWQPGAVMQDARTLPTGASYLVGLYDPTTGARLEAATADGAPLPDNAFPIHPQP